MDRWAASYSLGEPFEFLGELWKCIGQSWGPFDAYGYAPTPLLWAGEVLTAELWPRAWHVNGAPGEAGLQVRVGHATKGHPYIYTGRTLLASLNCGYETESSEPGRRSEKRDRPDNWPCLQL